MKTYMKQSKKKVSKTYVGKGFAVGMIKPKKKKKDNLGLDWIWGKQKW